MGLPRSNRLASRHDLLAVSPPRAAISRHPPNSRRIGSNDHARYHADFRDDNCIARLQGTLPAKQNPHAQNAEDGCGSHYWDNVECCELGL